MESTYKRLIDVTLEELKHELVKEIKKEFKEDFTRELRALLKDLKYNEPTRWVSRKRAAELLDVSFVTLNKWNKTGKLKAHKIGGIVRYDLEDINRKKTS
ncbi:helix-turn-helix domain-containing protein [Psychroflexus sp. CAK1W]|uniref:helix-turn-helix domain-containing protein n=1 Tax=Psychroflexus curvus TaxID=2873595 RepID=UPI001CCA8FA1|nr:helix-turn-helix domain-containing protein [Psychroflexus curvus]MBZ9626649.1 helix-turn-helix domain-containing protein [Psychroflexus curvus]